MKLLKEYGSVEAVIKSVARIPGTLGQKIAQHTKSIRMSYDLATIKRPTGFGCRQVESQD